MKIERDLQGEGGGGYEKFSYNNPALSNSVISLPNIQSELRGSNDFMCK